MYWRGNRTESSIETRLQKWPPVLGASHFENLRWHSYSWYSKRLHIHCLFSYLARQCHSQFCCSSHMALHVQWESVRSALAKRSKTQRPRVPFLHADTEEAALLYTCSTQLALLNTAMTKDKIYLNERFHRNQRIWHQPSPWKASFSFVYKFCKAQLKVSFRIHLKASKWHFKAKTDPVQSACSMRMG